MKRHHRHISEVVDTLTEFNVPGPECRRIASALTTIAAIDAAALEQAIEHMSDDEAAVVNGVLDLRRTLHVQWRES